MKKIVVSLVLVLLVSSGIGFVFQGLFDSFWKGFTASLICHFLAIVVINSLSRKKNIVAQLEDALGNVLALQTVKVTCPCGKGSYEEPLFINKDNIFKCEVCRNTFRVDVDYETVLQTNQPSLNSMYDSLQAGKEEEH